MADEDTRAEDGLAQGRSMALSDGIFAIAMTLLAFQIQPPDLTGNQVHHLARALGDLSGRFFVYLLSFWVIGLSWLAHHRLFRYVDRVDDTLMTFNLLFLMIVAALPFPSAVLGRYGSERVAVILYASAMTVSSSLLTLLWLVARRRGLLTPAASPARVQQGVWRSLATAVVFAVSIPVAVVAPSLAPYLWIALVPARWVPTLRRRRAAATP